MVTEYVLPNANLEEKDNSPKVLELTAAQKKAILALGAINEFTVRKVMRCSRSDARATLEKYHAEGRIKTRQERYDELYPSEGIAE